jgi:heptosyltransferase-3
MTPVPRTILVVCTRRIGDVLLTTPLIRTLKSAWPECQIDALVLPGTEGVLTGNPDLRHILLTAKGGVRSQWTFLRKLWRSYDLALAATGSDRARFLARWAGRRCIGLWAHDDRARGRQLMPGRWIDFDERGEHAIESPLRLATALGLPLIREVVPPQARRSVDIPELRPPYAVMHPWPKFRYKAWSRDKWLALARALVTDGLQVVLTGGPDAEERAFCAALASGIRDCADLSGRYSFAELAEVIARARIYIGPDTAMTHLAAATGTATIALFGPSDPVRWGPWPAGLRAAGSPWPRRGSGRAGRVWVVQGSGECVPCTFEGCERHIASHSRCLDELQVATVTAAVAQALALPD